MERRESNECGLCHEAWARAGEMELGAEAYLYRLGICELKLLDELELRAYCVMFTMRTVLSFGSGPNMRIDRWAKRARKGKIHEYNWTLCQLGLHSAVDRFSSATPARPIAQFAPLPCMESFGGDEKPQIRPATISGHEHWLGVVCVSMHEFGVSIQVHPYEGTWHSPGG